MPLNNANQKGLGLIYTLCLWNKNILKVQVTTKSTFATIEQQLFNQNNMITTTYVQLFKVKPPNTSVMSVIGAHWGRNTGYTTAI